MEDSQDRDSQHASDVSSIPSTAVAGNHSEVDPTSIRGALGNGMDRFSQLVNNNLIAARYGIFSGVALLTVYGLSQTPLFFRYRTVADVPASSFITRRRLYGRIIAVDTVENGDIQIQVRHLSPIGQILPKSWFDFLVKFSPQASRLGHVSSTTKPEENARDLLKVKIAGIHPPPISRLVYRPEQFLDRLAKERALVSCQLVARQVLETAPAVERSNVEKRPMSQIMPELAVGNTETSTVEKRSSLIHAQDQNDEVAICRVTYRPKVFQLFATDIAESLIATGNASVSTTILGREVTSFQSTATCIKDTSHRLQDLRDDVKYLDRLAKVEFEAASQSIGMWSVPEVRESKREVVEEVEFQTKASSIQKLWRWIRGG